MSARVTREAGIWVDQSAAAAAQVRAHAKAAAEAAWTEFDAWYDAAAVAAYAREVAAVSGAGQETITDLMAEYIGHATAVIRDQPRITIPKVHAAAVRNGVDPVRVHSRPAFTFKETFALTGDDELALQRAVERGLRLIEDDLMLAARQAQQDAMVELKVDRFRRVLRPELSEDGPCGLCVVASGRIYHVERLLPMHGRCKCETLPIDGDEDPGRDINREDLDRIYAAAGSTDSKDLKRTRVQVSEHGELGPVLHVRGDRFTGQDDLGEPIDPGVRERRLTKLSDVLAQLEQSQRDGADVNDQIGYQESAIARTEADGAGGGSGGGRPPAPSSEEDGRHLPVNLDHAYDGPLPAPGDPEPPTVAQIQQAGLLARGTEPWLHYTTDELPVAEWLRDRGVDSTSIGVTNAFRTPDGLLDVAGVTVEFKTMNALSERTAAGLARRGREQSRRVIIDGRQVGLTADRARIEIDTVLRQYGGHLDELVFILEDGSAVGWWDG